MTYDTDAACAVSHSLLEVGAYPNYMEANGSKSTPLDYALSAGHHETAELLVQYAAMSIADIENLAALTIQATWRGYQGGFFPSIHLNIDILRRWQWSLRKSRSLFESCFFYAPLRSVLRDVLLSGRHYAKSVRVANAASPEEHDAAAKIQAVFHGT